MIGTKKGEYWNHLELNVEGSPPQDPLFCRNDSHVNTSSDNRVLTSSSPS